MNATLEKVSITNGWLIVLLLATAVVANVMFNKTSGWTRLGIGLGVYAFLAVVMVVSRISLESIGLGLSSARQGLALGLLGSLCVVAVLGIVLYVSPDTFKDQRYDQDLGKLLMAIFVTLPIYTVLIEEVLFRGFIPAVLHRSLSVPLAYVVASMLFGLWHVLPSLTMKSVSLFGGAFLVPRAAVITSGIVAPMFAGFVFSWLAYRSKSIIAPIMVHWTINATGMIFAAIVFGRI